jgi:hypothetical protein
MQRTHIRLYAYCALYACRWLPSDFAYSGPAAAAKAAISATVTSTAAVATADGNNSVDGGCSVVTSSTDSAKPVLHTELTTEQVG